MLSKGSSELLEQGLSRERLFRHEDRKNGIIHG